MVDHVSNDSENISQELSGMADKLDERKRMWRIPAILTVLLVIVVFAAFWQTSWSMVSIWMRSETFTHGFLILPISGYLIWRKRKDLLRCTPTPNWWGIPILIGIGMVWLVAHSASVLILEQLAMMAMVPTLIWTILGWQATWEMAFPLAFLMFAVPMGEELIPYLMDFTADFTVSTLRLSGIPVFHEGTFFEIPSGRWSVVEGCSGVRYLIASVTLGTLYAYLTYQSLRRRLLFIAASVIVPLFANGLRAYMIVMIAHLSDMRLALGIDHIIYGWVFFGFVMLLLFWIGSFWRQDITDEPATAQTHNVQSGPASVIINKSFAAICAAVLITVVVWPSIGSYINREGSASINASLMEPSLQGGWEPSTKPLSVWKPQYINTDASFSRSYQRDGQKVSLYLAYYARQRQGAELINSQNVLIRQKDPVWSQTADSPYEVIINGKPLQVRLAKMRSHDQDLLVWYWYWVNGHTTTNHYLAKVWDAEAKLLGQKGDAAAVVVYTPLTLQIDDAEKVLKGFMTDMQPSIEASLESAVRE